MSNTIITSIGLNEVNRVYPSAPMFGIKYFVPVYDYRIDSDVNTGLTTPISYESTISATSAQGAPTGEIIWNSNTTNTYTISQKYIIASGTPTLVGSDYQITDYKQSSVGVGTNISAGYPLTTSFSGTYLYPPSISQDYWTISNFGTANGVGYISASNMRDHMWQTTDYYPVDSLGNIQGAFKCNIGNNIGTYKFNKIAMYLTRYNSDGTENISEPPKFFSECYINDVSVKSDALTDGFSNVIVDVRLDFNSYGIGTNLGFYSNSANDWTLTTSGIYYPDRVGIGSFHNGLSAPDAQVHIRSTTSDTNAMRIDSNTTGDINYYTVNVDGSNNLLLTANNGGAVSASIIKCIDISANNTNSDIIKSYNNAFVDVQSDLNCGAVSASNLQVFNNIYTSNIHTDYIDSQNSTNVYFDNANLITRNSTNIGTSAYPCGNITSKIISGGLIQGSVLSASGRLDLYGEWSGTSDNASLSYSPFGNRLTVDAGNTTFTGTVTSTGNLSAPLVYTQFLEGGGYDIETDANIIPEIPHSVDRNLGTSDAYWGGLYADSINGGSLTLNNASINAAGDIAGTALDIGGVASIDDTGIITGTSLTLTAANITNAGAITGTSLVVNTLAINQDLVYGSMVLPSTQGGGGKAKHTHTGGDYISLSGDSNIYILSGINEIYGIAKNTSISTKFNIGTIITFVQSDVNTTKFKNCSTRGGTDYWPFYHTIHMDISVVNGGINISENVSVQYIFTGYSWNSIGVY